MSGVLASFYTLAGDTRLTFRGGTEISPHDLRTRIEVASRCGYTGIGLGDKDLAFWQERHPPCEVRKMIDDSPLRVVELEMLYGWHADGAIRDESDRTRFALLEWAEALGAHHIKIGPSPDSTPGDTRLIDELARLGEQAREAGTRIAVEPMAVSPLSSPLDAQHLAVESGSPQVGLILDIWHMTRSAVAPDILANLSASRILAIELGDGSALPVDGDLVSDGCDHRRLPGFGDFDVTTFVAAVTAAGYQGPFGIESLSIENRSRTLEDAALANIRAVTPYLP
jgi:sugar phosphate isomerase/epimerase